MPDAIDATYRHVQGLSRGLAILRALNDAGPEGASPRELSEATALNRTTVKRLLETLVEEGYVLPCHYDGRYGLAPEVLSLSRGLPEDAQVLRHASPVMKDLGRETGWSLRISVMKTDCVVIRDSNHPTSQMSSSISGGLNSRLPILLTAAGRACFAYTTVEEREHIITSLRSRHSEQSALAHDDKLVKLLTQRVIEDGYAVNDGDWGERRNGAVGVPIRHRGRVLGSMSMLYTRRAVTAGIIESEFVPALRRSVQQIEAQL